MFRALVAFVAVSIIPVVIVVGSQACYCVEPFI